MNEDLTNGQIIRKEVNQLNRPFLITVILLLIALIFLFSSHNQKIPSDYKQATIWQLVDIREDLKEQLSWLNKKVSDIDTIICWKDSSLCLQENSNVIATGWVVEIPTQEVNQALNLTPI